MSPTAITSKKITHLVSSLNVGGAERFVIDLCQQQIVDGHQCRIISLGNPSDPLLQVCLEYDIPVTVLTGIKPKKVLTAYLKLRNQDIIHFHTQHVLKFLQMIVSRLKSKIIYTRHGAAPLAGEHWKKLHRKIRPFIGAMSFVSQEASDNFFNTHGWSSINFKVIDNGVILPESTRTVGQKEKFHLGSVGRMIPLKHQISLLDSVASLPKELQGKVAIHFFGDGPERANLEKYHQEHLADIEVTFYGMVNDRETIYSSFDLLVVTSETEGLSMVIIESMAQGIPVVATNVGGSPKLVLDKKTGWLFEYQDNEKLANIITLCEKEREVLVKIGQTARSHIESHFSIQSTANKYYHLYER
jgi:glycosyltransferase involved in cell wall biosynthesis